MRMKRAITARRRGDKKRVYVIRGKVRLFRCGADPYDITDNALAVPPSTQSTTGAQGSTQSSIRACSQLLLEPTLLSTERCKVVTRQVAFVASSPQPPAEFGLTSSPPSVPSHSVDSPAVVFTPKASLALFSLSSASMLASARDLEADRAENGESEKRPVSAGSTVVGSTCSCLFSRWRTTRVLQVVDQPAAFV